MSDPANEPAQGHLHIKISYPILHENLCMRSLFQLAGVLLLASCTPPNRLLTYPVNTTPVMTLDPPPQKILVMNTYDVTLMKYRENKTALFIALIDSMMQVAAERINKQGIKTELLKGCTKAEDKKDSIVYALCAKYKASQAIVFNSFDVYFDQTGVEVVRNSDRSKDKTAYYDIVGKTNFTLYDTSRVIKNMDVDKKYHHSARSVISGLLAAGPNVVVQHKDAWRIAWEVNQEFLNYFFPGEVKKTRLLFTSKNFAAVGQAILKNDYEAALIESLRLANSPDNKTASRAHYNCAVLFERKNQRYEVKRHLAQAILLAHLPEAKMMEEDYLELPAKEL